MRWLGSLLWLAWVPAFAVLFALGALATRTQVIFAYEYSGGRGYAGLADRHYHRCTYVGLPGITTVPAQAGRCAWLRLNREGGR